MLLLPWRSSEEEEEEDYDEVSFRPRRPSYIFATQSLTRQRSGSYQQATGAMKEDSPRQPEAVEFLEEEEEGAANCVRRNSYLQATEQDVDCAASETPTTTVSTTIDGHRVPLHLLPDNNDDRRCQGVFVSMGMRYGGTEEDHRIDSLPLNDDPSLDQRPHHHDPSSPPVANDASSGVRTIDSPPINQTRKNLFVLSSGFVLVFTAFRAIQNLESTLNQPSRLGVIAMALVHGTMSASCVLSPIVVRRLSSKWTMVIGLTFYMFWVAANFYPVPYTLIPASIGVGFGQSLVWGAQVSYIGRLAADQSSASKETKQNTLFRCKGFFLACFQTSHLWGNLASSLVLANDHRRRVDVVRLGEGGLQQDERMEERGDGGGGGGVAEEETLELPIVCGVFDTCQPSNVMTINLSSSFETGAASSEAVVRLMSFYISLVFVGFIIVVLFLENIEDKLDERKSFTQTIVSNLQNQFRHRAYRCFIPVLIFNGFEHGFIYSDYTKSFVSCALGSEYIGYNMIALGLTNSLSCLTVGLLAKYVAREVLVGIGSALHIGIMLFLVVWVPDRRQAVALFVISALWGICDSIWQALCNSLIALTSSGDDDATTFQNFCMFQSLGTCLAFTLSSFTCVAIKLYTLISLLILSVVSYSLTQYQLSYKPSTTPVDVCSTDANIRPRTNHVQASL